MKVFVTLSAHRIFEFDGVHPEDGEAVSIDNLPGDQRLIIPPAVILPALETPQLGTAEGTDGTRYTYTVRAVRGIEL